MASRMDYEEQVDVKNTPSKKREDALPAPKRKLLPMVLLGLAVLILAGGGYWFLHRNQVSTDDAQVDGHIAPIAAKISGNVTEVLVDNNMQVKAGQLLVKIDPRDYQVRVDQAKAAVLLAQKQAHAAQAGVPLATETTTSGTSEAAAQVSTAEAEYARSQLSANQAATSAVSAARANLASKQANNERAQADLARMRPLMEKAEISRQQFDAYVASARVAQAEVQAAQDQLTAAQQNAENAKAAVATALSRVQAAKAGLSQARAGQGQVRVTAAQAGAASAGVEQAKANLAAAELQLSYTDIYAPIDGVVTRKSVEVGQILQPGQSLMTIIPLHDVWVTANFKETQLKDVRPGQKATVKVDMYDREIDGKVDSIAGATGARLSLLPPENATGNFVKVVQRIPVKIVFDKLPQDVVLRPGMNVDATIATK